MLYALVLILLLVFVWNLNNLRFVPQESQLEISAKLDEESRDKVGKYGKLEKPFTLDITVKNVGDKPVHNLHISTSANINELKNMWWFALDENRGSRVVNVLDVGESINYQAVMGFEKFHSKAYDKYTIYFRRLIVSFICFILGLIFYGLFIKCLHKRGLKHIELYLGYLIILLLFCRYYYGIAGRNIVISNEQIISSEYIKIPDYGHDWYVIVQYTSDKVNDFIDKNCNNIPDCIEFRDYWSDTDGDGLTDYEEICFTGTSMIITDTYCSGIDDLNYDTDGDGLCNYYELRHGLDPADSDMDMDGLRDGEEVELGTNPKNPDTDKDGATDGFEVSNGYDPLQYDEEFEIEKEAVSEGKDGASTIKASVLMTASGEVVDSLCVRESKHELLNKTMIGYIGAPFEFKADGEFKEATISFEFDKSILNKEDFEPCIYYFNENTQLLEELDSVIVGNKVSAKVRHFSIYVLANKVAIDRFWGQDIVTDEVIEHTRNGLDVVILCDVSPSMYEKDPNGYRYLYSQEFIKMGKESDYISLVTFDDNIIINTGFTQDFDKLVNKVEVLAANQGETSGTNLYGALDAVVDSFKDRGPLQNRYVILISDGDNTNYTTKLDSVIKKANEANVNVYSVCIGGDDLGKQILKKLSDRTFGCYYEVSSDVIGSIDIDGLSDTFENIEAELIDLSIDSNKDGLTDKQTRLLCEGKLRTGLGEVLFRKYDEEAGEFLDEYYSYEEVQSNNDLDNDGLLNGEELEIREFNGKPYIFVRSLPNRLDSDNDTIDDKEDTAPMLKGLAGGIVGELTIASCSNDIGHSWLVYKDYALDEVKFVILNQGYWFDDSARVFKASIGIDNYDFKNCQYVSFGNSTRFGNGSAKLSNLSKDSWDKTVILENFILLNNEFYTLQMKGKDYYLDVAYYTEGITQEQFDMIVEYMNNHNTYNMAVKNCTTMAAQAWNLAFKDRGELQLDYNFNLTPISLPSRLKKSIMKLKGMGRNYQNIMYDFIEQMVDFEHVTW